MRSERKLRRKEASFEVGSSWFVGGEDSGL